jgi:hypothetical protein
MLLIRGPGTELFIAGDFNRHDLMRSRDHMIGTECQSEAQPIIEWAEDWDLQLLLPGGQSHGGRTGEQLALST